MHGAVDDVYLKVIHNIADFRYLLNLLGYMFSAVDDAYLFGCLLGCFSVPWLTSTSR